MASRARMVANPGFSDNPDVGQLMLERLNLEVEQVRESLAALREKREMGRASQRIVEDAGYAENIRRDRLGRDAQDVGQRIAGLERPTGNIPMSALWGKEQGQPIGLTRLPQQTAEGGYTNIPSNLGARTNEEWARMAPGLSRAEMDPALQDELNTLIARKGDIESQITGKPSGGQHVGMVKAQQKAQEVKPGWQNAQVDEEGNIWQMGPQGQMIRRASGVQEKYDIDPLSKTEYSRILGQISEIDKLLNDPYSLGMVDVNDPKSNDNPFKSQKLQLMATRDVLMKELDKIKSGMTKGVPRTGRSSIGTPDTTNRTVVRTGVDRKSGRPVVMYSDGTMEYANQ